MSTRAVQWRHGTLVLAFAPDRGCLRHERPAPPVLPQDKIVKTTSFSTLSDIPGMSEQLESLPRVKVASLGLSREEIALAPDVVIAGQQSYFEPKKGFATRGQLHAAGIQAYAPNFFCASNVDDPTPEALVAQKARTFEDDLKVITELGQIFNVNDRAAQLVTDIRQAYEDTQAKVASLPTGRVTVLEPSSAKPNAGCSTSMAGRCSRI